MQGNHIRCIYDGEEKRITGLKTNMFEYLGNTFAVDEIENDKLLRNKVKMRRCYILNEIQKNLRFEW